MGKVKVTKEQADTIERLRKYQRDEIERFTRNPSHFADWVSPLKNMDVNEIEDSLYIGYEVDPEIKEGDYVISEVTGKIGKVTEIKPNGHVVTDIKLVSHRDDFFLTGKPSMFEKKTPEEIATEKERRFFAENGRKPWELRRFDMIVGGHRSQSLIIEWVGKDGTLKTVGGYGYIDLDTIKKHYKVACFAKDRKDVN